MDDGGNGEFGRGWKVILASTLGVGLGLSPLPFYTSGVFIRPLSQAYGWSTAVILSALIGTTLGAVVAAPVAGFLADKFGVRRVALISCLLFGLSWILLAFTNGSVALFDASWFVVGVAGAGTLPLTWTRAINNRFVTHRGMALGIALFATGLFGAFSKVYANFLINHLGWRAAYIGIGLLPIAISLPVALMFFHDAPKAEPAAGETAPILSGKTVAGALGHWRFWLLGGVLLITAFALGGPVPNLEKILGTKGFDPDSAVLLASFIGYSVMVGRLAGGWLLDNVWAPLVGFVLLACPAASLAIISLNSTFDFSTCAFAVSLLGVALGAEYDLMAFLTSRYFGMRSYSAIYGILYGFYAIGAGFSPSLFGKIFDSTGSYDHILLIAASMTAFGAVLLLTLGRYPVWAPDEVPTIINPPAALRQA